MAGCGGQLMLVARIVRELRGGAGVGVRHELRQCVYRHREHDRRVVLRRDAVESLQIPQLENQ